MAAPTLFVIAGPNGIGKSTATFDAMQSSLPIINSDEIARMANRLESKPDTNLQEWSNREAMRLVDDHLRQRTSFGIETNLADGETWKFLIEVQRSGYCLHLLFLCTDFLEVLNSRIAERHRRGEHFVRPDVVQARYVNGLALLKHYFHQPDRVQLFDNSDTMRLVAERIGATLSVADVLPAWARDVVRPDAANSSEQSAFDSIAAARQYYAARKRGE